MAHKNFMACHDKYWCHEFDIQKFMVCQRKSWIAMKFCDTLLPNGMPCHHHMEELVIINDKEQQYF
jgi:DNA-directed RNA polymerase